MCLHRSMGKRTSLSDLHMRIVGEGPHLLKKSMGVTTMDRNTIVRLRKPSTFPPNDGDHLSLS